MMGGPGRFGDILNQETLKPRSLGNTLRRLGAYFGRFWPSLVLALLFVVIATWTQVTTPESHRAGHGLLPGAPRRRQPRRIGVLLLAAAQAGNSASSLLDRRRACLAQRCTLDHFERLSPGRLRFAGPCHHDEKQIASQASCA